MPADISKIRQFFHKSLVVIRRQINCIIIKLIDLAIPDLFSDYRCEYVLIVWLKMKTKMHHCRGIISQNEFSKMVLFFRKWDIFIAVSYTHLRAHETDSYLVCRLL